MTALDYARDKGLDYVVALMVCDDSAVMDFAKASRLVWVALLWNNGEVIAGLSREVELPLLFLGTL